MKDLPHDIIVDILSRLPVKTLVRFRCVSKLWRSAISDPQFVKLHLNRAYKDDGVYSKRFRLIFSCHNLYSLEYEAIGSDSGDLEVVELDYPLKDKPNEWAELLGHAKDGLLYCRTAEGDDDDDFPVIVKLDFASSLSSRNWVEILGSCNGLVCIVPYEDTLFLFNPATGESKRIPDPPVEIFPSEWNPNGVNVYGFGYDEFNDDYKVVRLASGVVVSVYSLRTDCWRRVESPPFNAAYETGRQLNGAIHWVVSCAEDMDSKCMVAAFDLGQEFFWDMPAPDVLDSSFDFAVGVFNECLCLLHNYGQMHNDFWVMKEYGVSESWTRFEISISYICMKPLCITKNDEALLEIDGKLVTYNFEDETCRDLVVRSIPVGVGFEADTYLESLVSPNAYGGSGQLQR